MNERYVHVANLGCKVNRAESDTIERAYVERGWLLGTPEQADLIIVNTCTVTAVATKKTRKAIRSLLKQNPYAPLIATGCAAVIDPDELCALDSRVTVMDKAELIHEVRPNPDSPLKLVNDAARVGIKVQDGCNHACTYCIVHVARGKSQSRSLSSIVQEAAYLAHQGIPEIVLTGIDLGAYSNDGSLAYLCKEILSVIGENTRIRLSSIEPCSFSSDIIGLIAAQQGRICRHVHLPLQSGSSKVLSEMHRPYNADYFLSLVGRLYEAIPRLSLSTDVIVGFPGETDDDFASTMEVVRQSAFTKVHVFKYSQRQGTPAAERTDQIMPSVMDQRAHALDALAVQLRNNGAQKRKGSVERVVVEAFGQGMSESYYKVEVPTHAIPRTMLDMPLQVFLDVED